MLLLNTSLDKIQVVEDCPGQERRGAHSPGHRRVLKHSHYGALQEKPLQAEEHPVVDVVKKCLWRRLPCVTSKPTLSLCSARSHN